MPDLWHHVSRPEISTALGRLMGLAGDAHILRRHEHYHKRGTGHLQPRRH
jgi:hypothetical protein